MVPDSRNYIILSSLHAVFPPTKIQLSNGSAWKPGIFDSSYSFTLFLKCINDFEPRLKELKARSVSKGLRLQPLIVVVGEEITNLQDFYVIFNDINYKLPSYLDAVDVCFKLIQVFNFKYPVESNLVWQLIQKFFYNINTAYDIINPKLTTILSKLYKH